MHLAIGILAIAISLKWANWKEWQRYYPTMLYIVLSNLLYKFFALSEFHIWKLSSHDFFFNNHIQIFLWHIFIINTLCTFVYLSNFPEGEDWHKRFFYILKWLAIYIICESILLKYNHVNYYHGWNIVWTLFFDLVMFLMLRLHFKKPLWAIILSVPNTLFYLFVFDYF
ncbi:MAG TPA: CBO0543 family protein [Pseudoneobacillus sp.]|nr:CBO0543 family protein [Pseudoneobacillus sp.]